MSGKPVRKHVPPDREILADLYLSQRLTGKQIGERLGVSPCTANKWLHEAGIEVRKPRPKLSREELHALYIEQGLSLAMIAERLRICPNRIAAWVREYGFPMHTVPGSTAEQGLVIPSAEQLHNLVHVQHLSYTEIGKRYGVSGPAVMSWLKTRGVARPRNKWYAIKKGGIVLPSREDLARMYHEEDITIREIADRYNVSFNSIRRLCKRLGVDVRPSGPRHSLYQTADGRRVRSSYELTVYNWLHSRSLAFDYDPLLPFGTRHRADFKVGDLWIEIWGVTSSPAYRQTRQWKRGLYTSTGLRLLELAPADFSKRAGRLWESKLRKFL